MCALAEIHTAHRADNRFNDGVKIVIIFAGIMGSPAGDLFRKRLIWAGMQYCAMVIGWATAEKNSA